MLTQRNIRPFPAAASVPLPRPPLPPPLTLKGAAPARRTIGRAATRVTSARTVRGACAREFASSCADSGFSRLTSQSAANSVSMETVREGGGRRQEGGGGGGA